MRFTISTAYLPPEEIVPLARAADEAGYHGMSFSDHVVNIETLRTSYPYTESGERRWKPFTPWVDPMVAIGAAGAVTTNLRFTTNVYVLPMRDPFTVAKTVASASVLTGGRVALGVGMGWCEDEFELLDQPFKRRGARADEMLDLLAALWSGEWTEHHGEFYDVPRLEMNPAPPGPVPIYVGGVSEAALRRAARHDGWVSDLMTTDEAADTRIRIDRYREESGRTGDFAMTVSLNDAVSAADFRRAEEAGVTDIITMPWVYHGGFRQTLDQKFDGLRRFADEVVTPLAS